MQAVPGGKPGPDVIARGGNNSWAPDIIRSGDKYFLYYAAPGTQPKAAMGLLVGRTLDPASPDYKWEDAGPVVWSDGVEDSNAIDPGVMRDPTNGTMWLTYGSYFGYIRLVELDPKTGKRLHPEAKPINIAINSEASVMIFHDGWYYLLVTHGSCCAGANSSYNIRMGRSRKVTGPFLDNMGIDMLQGGGKLFAGSSGRHIGPGHFGLLDLGDGVQKFSCHYEADLDRGGISVLDIRPLLWRDGWPVAGDNVTAGTYEIESVRTGTALEMAVQGVPVGGARGRGGAAAAAHRRTRRHDAATPDSGPGRRASRDLLAGRPGGCPHGALHAAGAAEMVDHACATTPAAIPGRPISKSPSPAPSARLPRRRMPSSPSSPSFTGGPEQLWRIDQLTDGTYRLMPKSCAEREGAAGAVRDRQQHADTRKVQTRQRSTALAAQDTMTQPLACVVACAAERWRFSEGPRTPRGQQPAAAAARSGADVDASVNARQTAGRRWIPAALARARAYQGAGTTHRECGARGNRKGILPEPAHGHPTRRRQSDCRLTSQLVWHAVDTTNYNVNLYHFAYALNKPTSNVLFWAVTRVEVPHEMRNVRLAIGSNAASIWWLNGEEVIAIYGDRQTVIDDGVSKRVTLTKGAEYDSCGRHQRRRRHGFLRAVPRRGRHSGQGDFGAADRRNGPHDSRLSQARDNVVFRSAHAANSTERLVHPFA